MTRSARWGALMFALVLAGTFGCSTAPKPLPGGPPPEYEAPRGYNGSLGEPQAAPPPGEPTPSEPAAPSATPAGPPRPLPDPAKPGDPQAAPPN